MIRRAIGLKERIEALGIEVIEVYPYASKVRLFGRPIPKKTRSEGRRWLRQRLGPLIEVLAERPSLNHDQLDAITAAHTAWLHAQSRTEAIGDPSEGVIVLPRLNEVRSGLECYTS